MRCCWPGAQFGGLNSLNMPGTAGHGPGSYTITVRTARRGDAAAELAGDGRRRHRRQRVGHRGRAASGRHVSMRRSNCRWTQTSNCRPTPPRRSPRPRCWARSTSSWPRRRRAGGRAGWLEGSRSRSTAPVAIPPPRKCCRRWVSWSTRAISVRCRTSPTRRTPRSPAGPAPSPIWCPGWPN